MNNDVHEGSQVFIQMPGNHVLSGVLERNLQVANSEIEFFYVLTPHGGFTANLHTLPIENSRNSHRVTVYRCFIPISGNRVLTAFLKPEPPAPHILGTTRITIRIPGQRHLYSGDLHLIDGAVPEWIPRHI